MRSHWRDGGAFPAFVKHGVIDDGNGAGPMFRFAGGAGHGEGAPTGMPADTGDVDGGDVPVRRAGFTLGEGLETVGEGFGPVDRELLLNGEFVIADRGVLHGEFALDGGSVAEGEDVNFEFAFFGAERADEIEDHGFGNAEANGAFHTVIGIDFGLRGSGREQRREE